MKKIKFLFPIIAAFLIIAAACDKDEDKLILDMDQAVAPTLLSPEPDISLDLEQLAEAGDSIFFEWTDADYKEESLPDLRYRLIAYITDHEDNFQEHSVVIRETSETSANIPASTINQRVFQMGVVPFEYSTISFRIKAFLNLASDATWLYSGPVDTDLRIYEIFTFAMLGGDYNDWNYEESQGGMLHSPDVDNQFEGYLYFEEDNAEVRFSMGTTGLLIYGDDNGDGKLDQDGEPIVVPEEGVYRISIDYDAMTYELFKTEWALIGDAAEGWNTDVPMDVDEEHWEEHYRVRYSITHDFVEGHFKFRANEEWDPPAGLNLGVSEDDDAEEGDLQYFGFGNDIPIDSPGEYTVILDLTGPVYRYEIHHE